MNTQPAHEAAAPSGAFVFDLFDDFVDEGGDSVGTDDAQPVIESIQNKTMAEMLKVPGIQLVTITHLNTPSPFMRGIEIEFTTGHRWYTWGRIKYI